MTHQRHGSRLSASSQRLCQSGRSTWVCVRQNLGILCHVACFHSIDFLCACLQMMWISMPIWRRHLVSSNFGSPSWRALQNEKMCKQTFAKVGTTIPYPRMTKGECGHLCSKQGKNAAASSSIHHLAALEVASILWDCLVVRPGAHIILQAPSSCPPTISLLASL